MAPVRSSVSMVPSTGDTLIVNSVFNTALEDESPIIRGQYGCFYLLPSL